MSLEQMNKVIGSVSKLIENSEKIAVPVLSAKLAKATENYPEDQTISVMSNIISKMSNSNKIFISRGELKDLYNRLYTRNTKFAQLFIEELGEINNVSQPTIYERDGEESKLSTVKEAFDKLSDPVLLRALNGAFGSENYKPYSEESENNAKSICNRELRDIGLTVQNLEVVAGQEDLIICNASFETPKGISRVCIPVEIKNAKCLIPSVFIGNAGPEDLTKSALSAYVSKFAGKKLEVDSNKVLKVIASVRNSPAKTVTAIELAVTKLNASKESKGEFFAGQILFQKVAEELKTEVETPFYNDPEAQSFAEMLTSASGIAEFKFGKNNVNKARKIIDQTLHNFGFANSQISVIDTDDSTVIYAVALNGGKAGFRVPVKISGNSIKANLIISNGSIKAFSKSSIVNLLNKEDIDHKIIAAASPLYNLKASELVNIVREAIEEQNLPRAEDALNVLLEGDDAKAYATAFSLFKDSLSKTASTKEECKCSMIIKSANSKYDLCGHTNLPLHKIYQDNTGNCQPLYRRGKDETYEGGFFMAHKVLL